MCIMIVRELFETRWESKRPGRVNSVVVRKQIVERLSRPLWRYDPRTTCGVPGPPYASELAQTWFMDLPLDLD